MSSGAYHFSEAEKLVESAREVAREHSAEGASLTATVMDRILIALNAAGVHASLARTAAVAEAGGLNVAEDWGRALYETPVGVTER